MLKLEQPLYLALPRPISTNNLFVNVPGRGRVMSKKYRKWKVLAAQWLDAQKPLAQFAIQVDVICHVGEVYGDSMDSDNTLKAYLDVIKTAGVIHDDSRKWVRSSKAVWTPGIKGCVALIAPAEPAPAAAELCEHLRRAGRDLLYV